MNGLELFLLGRRLMKLGKDAIPRAGFHQLPTSVRSVLLDVMEHPDTSVGEITARTGFPQSHVSASVARLREGGALVTTVDPKDRRRTLVRVARRASPDTERALADAVRGAVAGALGTEDSRRVEEIMALLETLNQRLAGQRN